MKRLLLALFMVSCLLAALPAAAQTPLHACANTGASTDVSCTLNSTSAGNLLVAFVSGVASENFSIVDSSLDNWTAGPSASNNGKIQGFYLPNGPGGNVTVHCVASALTTVHCQAMEFANIPVSGVLSAAGAVAEGVATVTTSTAVTQPLVTAVGGFLSWSTSNTFTAGNIGGVQGSIFQGQTTSGAGMDVTEGALLSAANGPITANLLFGDATQIEGVLMVFNTLPPAPTVPTGLSAVPVSGTQVNLSWTASTSQGTLAGYKIYRNGAQVGTSTVTSYSDGGLIPATAYTYSVSAYDTGGRESAKSTPVSAATPDTIPPTAPTSLTATAASTSQVNVAWTAASDNVAVTGYKIFRNGAPAGTVSGTTYSDTGLSPQTSYSYTVSAFDAAGNVSPSAGPVTGTTNAVPPPTVPTALTAVAASGSQINLSWTGSTSQGSLAGYKIYRSGVQVGTSIATSYGDTGLTPATSYTYAVSAYDTAGAESAKSASASATTPDTIAPTVPTGLTASGTSTSQVNVAWTSATDNVAVTGYKIFRNGAQVGTVPGNAYSDTGLTAQTSYSYTVSAFDAAGNVSALAGPVSATTKALPPTVPAGLTASAASGTQINLAWTASTSGIGVAGYRIYRNGVLVGTSTATAYGDTGLASVTTYSYAVTAFDTAGAESAKSASASATTLDSIPPTPPTGLTATGASTTQVNLAWTAGTDNVAVAGYRIFRNGAQVGTAASTAYSDTGLAAQTSYSYTVSAFDAAGNVSTLAGPVTGTTTSTAHFVFDVYGGSRGGNGGTAPDCFGNSVHAGIVNQILNENPDLVLHNGDMVTGYSDTTNWVQNGSCKTPGSTGSAKNILAPLLNHPPAPGLPAYFFPSIGNHDDDRGDAWYPDPFGNGWCDVFNPHTYVPNHTQEPFYSSFKSIKLTDADFYSLACSPTDRRVYADLMYYSFNYKNSHFIVLHINNDPFNLLACNSCGTNLSNYDDYYNIHQLDWLRWDLANTDANPAITNTFVIFHAPVFTTAADHPQVRSWSTLATEFSKHKVKVVFHGHNHVYERTVPIVVNTANPNGIRDDANGTVYITTGGAGSPLAGFDQHPALWFDAYRASMYHHIRVTVDGNSIKTEMIDVNGNLIDSGTR